MLNVIFACYHSFASNSAIHIFHLANGLVARGVACTVAVPRDPESVREIGTPAFRACTFEEALRFDRAAGRTLVHAWTPRENVRRFTLELAARLACPYVVHLEDNEDVILEHATGVPVEELLCRRESEVIVPDAVSHPHRYRAFLAGASGVTALVDRLLEFVPPGVARQVFWPGFDPGIDWCRPPSAQLRVRLGLTEGEHVLVYTGNVHAANRGEVSSLYLAVALLRRQGARLRLVRTGTDHARPYAPEIEDVMRDAVLALGRVPREELPAILSLADVLVQPGAPDRFNDYRFPSKLPEFLASGRPVLLPRSNVGRHLADGRECVLLERGNALEIARKLGPLLAEPQRRREIGEAGRAFALSNLSWARAVPSVMAFYEALPALRAAVANGRSVA
jgi:glycosyltransferase involved in cell wall biosynthesis